MIILIRDSLVPAKVDELPIIYKSFTWWTEYSNHNDTELDSLWDAILPSHGVIAVDREWAAKRSWPDSMQWPSDERKSVYLLEAYHQIHCIVRLVACIPSLWLTAMQKIIRQTFWEAVRRKPYTYKIPHAVHCFDFLRQVSYACSFMTALLFSTYAIWTVYYV